VLASQVMEHVPNPIRWLNELAAVMKVGGLLAISLPDRRMTFDLYREETRPADIIAAYLANAVVPDVRAVYDNQSLASAVNMHWLFDDSETPEAIVAGRGAVSARIVQTEPMVITRIADSGTYLDAHCWVFTPASFLLAMAQIAKEGLLQFRCKQFYPTNEAVGDRDNASMIAILQKVDLPVSPSALRDSFLQALGE